MISSTRSPATLRDLRLLLLLVAGVVSGLGLGACSKNDAANAEDTQVQIDRSPQDLYEAKQYAAAKEAALREAKDASGRDKEVAQLTAGLSAHALQQYDEAVTLLEPLTLSKDARIQSRAKSALDMMVYEQAHKAVASTNAARPAFAAPASAYVSSSAGGAAPGPTTGFALQAGVFTSKVNAKKRASEIRAKCVQAGLGTPRIINDQIKGTPAFAVQVGSFTTRQAASAAKSSLTGTPLVVVPVP